jgi:hypothetical protein
MRAVSLFETLVRSEISSTKSAFVIGLLPEWSPANVAGGEL